MIQFDSNFKAWASDILSQERMVGFVIFDKAFELVHMNEKALEMFSLDAEQLPGRHVNSLYEEEYHSEHFNAIRRVQRFAPSADRLVADELMMQAVKRNGYVFPVEVWLSIRLIDGEPYFAELILDKSQEAILEKGFTENTNKLNAIINSAADGIVTLDAQGNIETVNPTAANIFGYRQRELYGKNFQELVHPDDGLDEDGKVNQIFLSYESGVSIPSSREILGRSKSGEMLHVKLSVGVVHLPDRKMFTCILHDLSAIKEVEEQLKSYAEDLERSNRDLEEFAYVSSHDLQEPLRKIRAFGDRLMTKEQNNLSETGVDYLNRMMNAAKRMQKLINDLLRFSRVGSKKAAFQPIDLNHIVKEVLNDLEVAIEKEQAVVEIDDLPEIESDSSMMRQLFQNMISNALKFRSPDRPPVIKITNETAETANGKQKYVQLAIIDNGIGFDQRYVDKIFTIFQRLEGQKYEGSGVGLAICKKIVELHGGQIEAKSDLGHGSRFAFKLLKKGSKTY
ncbi:PAS domain S-box protein [Persicobacter psychrovividus]|uniref:histidine kinase n=1 Tax=Persicobacter psychrovividus TaxID=387638 RepID=A0ABN6L866_9BACT|nr:hypothetical protein PEPS_14910 [Persicobacter psychrovividus]